MTSQYNKDKPWLIVPIEVKAREYESKLLFSFLAAESGFNVIFGQRRTIELNIKYLPLGIPRGIYFDKSLYSSDEKKYAKFKDLGYKIVCLDEEGLLFNEKLYLEQKLPHGAFSKVDLFFAWGNYQKDVILSKEPDASEKIVISGHPRIDVLNSNFNELYLPYAKYISKIHGKYILINTNFGMYNIVGSFKNIINRLLKNSKIKEEDIPTFERRYEYDKGLYNQFVDMINKLSINFPQYNIVIRPHPVENQYTWINELKHLKNVKVIRERSSISWIMAAEAVIHNSCTTGIESFLLDTPVFSYRPITSNEFEHDLPNSVSEQVFDCDTLINKLSDLSNRKESNTDYDLKLGVAKKYIGCLDKQLSSELIIENLHELNIKPDNFSPVQKLMSKTLNYLFCNLNLEFFVRYKGDYNLYKLHKQTFSTLTYEELNNTLKNMSEISGKFTNINIEKISENIFSIKNK